MSQKEALVLKSTMEYILMLQHQRCLTAKIHINGKQYISHDGPKTSFYRPYLSGNTFAVDIFV